jgi:addiction module HigA family antidote
MKRIRPPTHPGAIIKHDYLEPLSLSIVKLAEHLKVSRVTVSKIVNEHAPVTPEMALRLSRVFDTTPQLWLGLQREYDLWHIQHFSEKWQAAQPLKR